MGKFYTMSQNYDMMKKKIAKSSPDTTCYLCGGKHLAIIRTRLRHDIHRKVLRCQHCGIVYLKSRGMNFDRYYNSVYRKRYTPVIGKAVSSRKTFDLYLPHQRSRIEEIMHILQPSMKVLDIGCSTGHFLYAIKSYVKEYGGIELNKKDAVFAGKKLGIKIFTKPIEKTAIEPGSLDLVTAWQVIEHMDDPRTFLCTVNKYIKPGGYICVETPSINDALLSVYMNSAYANFWFREPHIFYFSPHTILKIMEKAGFKGKVKTTQSYGLFNHMNWMLTGRPQASFDIGTSVPRFTASGSDKKGFADEFNTWTARIDKEYKDLLTKYGFGENVLFIGKKI